MRRYIRDQKIAEVSVSFVGFVENLSFGHDSGSNYTSHFSSDCNQTIIIKTHNTVITSVSCKFQSFIVIFSIDQSDASIFHISPQADQNHEKLLFEFTKTTIHFSLTFYPISLNFKK